MFCITAGVVYVLQRLQSYVVLRVLVFSHQLRFHAYYSLSDWLQFGLRLCLVNQPLFCWICLGGSSLRENRRFDARLDDSCVDGQNGEDDARQKHQGQLVDVLYSDKHDRGHRGQQDGAVHAHVVEQRCLRFSTLQTLQRKDCCFGCDIDLRQRVISFLLLTFICRGKTHLHFSHKSPTQPDCYSEASWRQLFQECQCYSFTFTSHFPQPIWGFNLAELRSQTCFSSSLLTAEVNTFHPRYKKRKRSPIKQMRQARGNGVSKEDHKV